MAKVAYLGPADTRVLEGKDLGVDGFPSTEFPRLVGVEVTDEVAKLLVENSPLGPFSLVGEPATAEEPAVVEPTAEISTPHRKKSN